MSPSALLDRRAREASSLEDAAWLLTILFSEGYSVWSDGTLLHTRQLVDRIGALQIHVYANEHPPPHFHIKGNDVDAVFTIDNCTFIRGNIDRREKGLVEWWYARTRPQLIAAWNSSRPTDCPVGPIHEPPTV